MGTIKCQIPELTCAVYTCRFECALSYKIPYKLLIFWYQQKEQIMYYMIQGDFFLF